MNQGAIGAQDTFYNKLNNQQNYVDVNAARTGLYNDYINQMKMGQYSQDLADMLGIHDPTGRSDRNGNNGVINTYNPTGALGQNDININNVSQKLSPLDSPNNLSPIGSSNQNGMTQNQFRQYNIDTSNSATNPNNYLTKGRSAQNFQDLLLQPDYNTYNALNTLSGRDIGKASGATELNPAVSKSNVNDFSQDVAQAEADFRQNYLKDYSAHYLNNTGTEVYQNLNDYLYKGELDPKYRYTGGTNDIDPTSNGMNSYVQSVMTSQLKPKLDAAVANSGVKNVSTVTDENTVDRYKKFKGLL